MPRLARAARFVLQNVDDVVASIGFACVAYGLSCWSVPAAWVVSGALLMAIAIVPNLRRKPHGPAE